MTDAADKLPETSIDTSRGSVRGGRRKVCYGKPVILAGSHAMPFSSAVRAGDLIFVSGVTAVDEHGNHALVGIEAQTRRILDRIRDVLAEAGCGLSDVVKTTVWLDDPRDFWNFNRVYREYFPVDPPARSCVRSSLMLDGKIEIEAIAYDPQ